MHHTYVDVVSKIEYNACRREFLYNGCKIGFYWSVIWQYVMLSGKSSCLRGRCFYVQPGSKIGATFIYGFFNFNLIYATFLQLLVCSADNLWAFGIVISVCFISHHNCLASQYVSRFHGWGALHCPSKNLLRSPASPTKAIRVRLCRWVTSDLCRLV